MSMRSDEPRVQMVLSSFVALILSTLPLPPPLDAFRPPLLVLVVLYWSIATPRAGGLTLGFAAGLALDAFQGVVLGQNALAMSLIAYIAVREHQKIRSKPFFQQALIVLAALFLYEFMIFSIDGWSGHPLTSPSRWLHIATGAAVWPVLAALLERTHQRR
jgi:rod shape-determining protein MreD